jgi:hypothetical protein
MINDSTDIFNGPALAIGVGALLTCLTVQGGTVVLVMAQFKSRIRALVGEGRIVTAHVPFFAAIITLLMSHMVQIYIWAKFLYYPGIVPEIHQAVILAGSTYTTVGFATDNLPLQWQLLSVTMAVTGLFAFAWSTSSMYALSQQLYRSED